MFRGTEIQIRLPYLDQNFNALKSMVSPGFLCPMVKANAYGHGASVISERLVQLGVQALGVATLDEALDILPVQDKAQILVFSKLSSEAAELIVEKNFVAVVSDFQDLQWLADHAKKRNKKIPIHIKLDTGIHRMGFPVDSVEKISNTLKQNPALELKGLLTHLSHGEDVANPNGFSERQISLFFNSIKPLVATSTLIHILNSHAMIARSQKYSDVPQLGARPGYGLYGTIPNPALSEFPVMRIVSRIDSLKKIPKGEGVSYGWKWIASRDSQVAVVPIGYADGYLRALGNKGEMLLHGQRVPVIGAVCMDYCILDVTEVANSLKSRALQIGDEVIVLGEQSGDLGSDQISAHELAVKAGTIGYEVLTNFGIKNQRVEVSK